MNKRKLLITIIGVSIFSSGIAYAQDYGMGAADQKLQSAIREGSAIAHQEIEKQMLVQQTEDEKNNQTLLILAIGIPTLVTGVIILLLTKRKSHDSKK